MSMWKEILASGVALSIVVLSVKADKNDANSLINKGLDTINNIFDFVNHRLVDEK